MSFHLKLLDTNHPLIFEKSKLRQIEAHALIYLNSHTRPYPHPPLLPRVWVRAMIGLYKMPLSYFPIRLKGNSKYICGNSLSPLVVQNKDFSAALQTSLTGPRRLRLRGRLLRLEGNQSAQKIFSDMLILWQKKTFVIKKKNLDISTLELLCGPQPWRSQSIKFTSGQ